MNEMPRDASEPTTALGDVTVKVPVGTEEAFRKLAAAWVEAVGSSTGMAAPSQPPAVQFEQLLQPASKWWRSLNAVERGVWGLWIDSAPDLVPASRMVSALGLDSERSIRGKINRMARKASEAGFQAGWQSDKTDPMTGERLYGVRDFGTGKYDYDTFQITGAEYAALLRRVRAEVDGHG